MGDIRVVVNNNVRKLRQWPKPGRSKTYWRERAGENVTYDIDWQELDWQVMAIHELLPDLIGMDGLRMTKRFVGSGWWHGSGEGIVEAHPWDVVRAVAKFPNLIMDLEHIDEWLYRHMGTKISKVIEERSGRGYDQVRILMSDYSDWNIRKMHESGAAPETPFVSTCWIDDDEVHGVLVSKMLVYCWMMLWLNDNWKGSQAFVDGFVPMEMSR